MKDKAQEILNRLLPLDIILVRAHGLGNIIGWWTTSNFDHVALYLGNGEVMDARPFKGVQKHSVMDLLKNDIVVLRGSQITLANEHKIIDFALSQQGKGYDWAGLAGFVFAHDFNERNRYFCSEFVAHSFLEGQYRLVARKTTGLISPELLFQSLALQVVYSNFDYNKL